MFQLPTQVDLKNLHHIPIRDFFSSPGKINLHKVQGMRSPYGEQAIS
jgi:hypothetical protein